MIYLYYIAIGILIVTVLYALRVHHSDRAKLEAWTSDWNTGEPLCCWRAGSSATELCLQSPGAAVHLTPDDVRDPRRQTQQTTENHVFVEGRLMRRFAGIDPYLVCLSEAVVPASVKAGVQGIELTDTILAVLAAVGRKVQAVWRDWTVKRPEYREWQETVGLRRIKDEDEQGGQ